MSIRIKGEDRASTINVKDSVSPGSHIGTYHLADNTNLYEVQRSNNFEFIVTDINNIVRAGMDPSDNNARITNAQEILRLSVSAAAVPHFTQGVITVRRGNSAFKFAGVPEFPAGSFKVVDYIGADTKAALMAWQNLSYNVMTEKVGLASDYKKDCYLFEYSPDYQLVRSWKLHGCWISGISEPDYDSDNGNDKRLLSVDIQYDRAEIDTSSDI